MPRTTFRPLTPATWDDFRALFGPRGACAGCWCTWWRRPASAWKRGRGDGNRRAMKRLVDAGQVAGILAYRGGKPVGWVSIGPRDEFPRLEGSRVLARVDDLPTWSIVCFFVAKEARRSGLTRELIEAAVRLAKARGARRVEAYPVQPSAEGSPDVFAFTGVSSTFAAAGFTEAARRSPKRAVWRRELAPPRT